MIFTTIGGDDDLGSLFPDDERASEGQQQEGLDATQSWSPLTAGDQHDQAAVDEAAMPAMRAERRSRGLHVPHIREEQRESVRRAHHAAQSWTDRLPSWVATFGSIAIPAAAAYFTMTHAPGIIKGLWPAAGFLKIYGGALLTSLVTFFTTRWLAFPPAKTEVYDPRARRQCQPRFQEQPGGAPECRDQCMDQAGPLPPAPQAGQAVPAADAQAAEAPAPVQPERPGLGIADSMTD